MSAFKSEVNIETASHYLERIMDAKVSEIDAIDMGELSKVFRFACDGDDQRYVVHFRGNRESFDKTRFVYENYASSRITMPKIIAIGQIEQVYYAISERIPGEPINQLPIDAQSYGRFNAKGQATGSNWLTYFESFYSKDVKGATRAGTTCSKRAFSKKTSSFASITKL